MFVVQSLVSKRQVHTLVEDVAIKRLRILETAYGSYSLFPNSSLGTHIRKAPLCSQ